ncbi:MAG: hypothetical protein HY909_25890 [Deltaproteobacteria bacterium]|nr:hypothetical protein [Deltaproteobacteria bacterium]
MTVVLAPAVALADPTPLVPVTLGGRGPSTTALAAATQALGADGLPSRTLRQRLAAELGAFPPEGDPLQPTRREIDSAIEQFFARGPTQAGPRLRRALATLDAAPDALSTLEANRLAWLRATTTLARIELERRNTAAADEALRRALRFSPAWQPDTREFPPTVTDRYRALAAESPVSQSTLTLSTPEGCRLELDGVALTENPTTGVTTYVGDHVVVAWCGQDRSRVHHVRLGTGSPAVHRVDPALDRALTLDPEVSLRVDGEDAFGRSAASFARALAASLGAPRVVFVLEGEVRVFEGASGTALGAVGASQLDHLPGLLRPTAPGTGVATPAENNTRDPAPSPPTARTDLGRRNPWPWVLVGVGGAALVASGVTFYLRSEDQATLDPLCSEVGGQRVCPEGASGLVDRVSTLDTISGVALGVGATLVVGGVLWALLAPRRAESVRVAVDPAGRSVLLQGSF